MSAPGGQAPAEPRLLRFGPDGAVPNNPALPVVLIPGAVPGGGAEAIHALYRASGWAGGWTWTVYDFTHYHPDAHEALTVAAGWAEIQLGGPGGPVERVEAGDALVLPAGTGHRRIAASDDFAICGAYPPGQADFDTVRAGDSIPAGTAETIAAVPLPETDPLRGADGPLARLWRAAADSKGEAGG